MFGFLRRNKVVAQCITKTQHPVLVGPVQEDEIVFKELNQEGIECLVRDLQELIIVGKLPFQKTSNLFPTYEIHLHNCRFEIKRDANTLGIFYYFYAYGPHAEDRIKVTGREKSIYDNPDYALYVKDFFYAFRVGREQEELATEDAADLNVLCEVQELMHRAQIIILEQIKDPEERRRRAARYRLENALLPTPEQNVAKRKAILQTLGIK